MDLDWREKAVADALEHGSSGLSTEAGGMIMAAIKRNRPRSKQVSVHHESQERALEILRQEVLREPRGLITGVSRYEGCGTVGQRSLYTWFSWYAFVWEGEEVELAAAPFADSYKLIFFSESPEAAMGAASLVGERAMWPAGSCLEFHGSWSDAPEMDAELAEASWEDIVLPEETVSGIRLSSEGFFDRREGYHAMGFPWQRGLMFVGPPGTGKTMVMKAIAAAVTGQKPEVPFLYVREFGEMGVNKRDIASIFARARGVAPCILAFEDIDGFVNEGNRSVFLNWLDGFQRNDGVLVLASSNHPGRVDEALLKRPSRFDRVFHLGLPALEERERYLRALLSAEPVAGRFGSRESLDEAAARVAGKTEGFTPAHLKETVLSAALVLAHGESPRGEDHGEEFGEALLEQAASLRAYMKSARLPEKLGETDMPGDPPGFAT